MGRTDGSARLTSPADADDTGANVLHVDMDAFFAAVAVLDDPALAGKPVIIGSRDPRSVVSSASYEARRYGVRSAMPVSRALQLCPHAEVVSPPYSRFQELSGEVMRILENFTPLVEQLSIDEAFLDVRGARRLWGTPKQVASAIRARVLEQTGLTCSIGVAGTKHVAKIASTVSKPNGLLVVPVDQTRDFLAPLPASAIWGIGPRSVEELRRRNIATIADIRAAASSTLERALGVAGARHVRALADGLDERAVTTVRVEKSISHEETFSSDVADPRIIDAELVRLADRVAKRLRDAGLVARRVAIKVRFDDFTTLSRSLTLAEPSNVGQRIAEAARELFAALDTRAPIRLIGVRAEQLSAGVGAFALWDEDEHWRAVDTVLDTAAAKFGGLPVTRAASLMSNPGTARRTGRGDLRVAQQNGAHEPDDAR